MHSQKFPALLIAALTIILILTLASTAWAAEYKVLYKFQGGADGASPYAGLIFDTAGNLYGTTLNGGAYSAGTVFKLTPTPDGSWNESVIHSFSGFSGSDGRGPLAGLIFDAAGSLYGTTGNGGDPSCSLEGCGTVFKLMPNPDGSWSGSVIHRFSSGGRFPEASLIFDAAGNLYGTTFGGGAYDYGTVFKLTPNPDGSWSENTVCAFGERYGKHNGRNPSASLILDPAGNLYGTTGSGGRYDYGTVFKLAPTPDGTWTWTKLHIFTGPDGAYPSADVTLDAAGNLYSTTLAGGGYGDGTAFKLTPNPDGSWTRRKLHTFKGPDGAFLNAGLIFDPIGNLYGTTGGGGKYDSGTVFKLTPQPDGTWKRAKLHAFEGPEGAGPVAGLIFDAAGNLYGTTTGGGRGYGVVFKITP